MRRLQSAPNYRIWKEKQTGRFLIREQDTDECQERYVIVFETLPCGGEDEIWRSNGYSRDGKIVFPDLPEDFPMAVLNEFLGVCK